MTTLYAENSRSPPLGEPQIPLIAFHHILNDISNRLMSEIRCGLHGAQAAQCVLSKFKWTLSALEQPRAAQFTISKNWKLLPAHGEGRGESRGKDNHRGGSSCRI